MQSRFGGSEGRTCYWIQCGGWCPTNRDGTQEAQKEQKSTLVFCAFLCSLIVPFVVRSAFVGQSTLFLLRKSDFPVADGYFIGAKLWGMSLKAFGAHAEPLTTS